MLTDDIFCVSTAIDLMAIDKSMLCFSGNCDDSKEYIKSISRKIDMSSKPIFDYFFKINNVPIERYPQYHCSPIWNECYNSYKWRYMVVRHNECNYLVFLRIVGVMYHEQHVAISYDILCDKPSKQEKNVIVGLLKKIPCIKKAEIITNDDDWDNVNFYNDETLKVKNYKRNKVSQLYDLGVKSCYFQRAIPKEIKDKIQELYSLFNRQRFKFNVGRQNKYLEILLSSSTMPIFVFMYNERVIGVKLCSNDFGNSAFIHSTKDISGFDIQAIADYTNCNIENATLIKKFIGTLVEDFAINTLLNEFGFSSVFFDGVIKKTEKGLFEHKSRYYKKYIKYKLIDINDYEC